ncbi:hypothetical protein E2C01_030918 [Portunus trituberculatus]|uniref:Secreted protein n=1 Tax=Portunus trituberculatus TaxID=210409 RepID=A0A5B7EWP5_PORTR|nr:hypothetical protein [Portunus trituberculatus]
MLPDRALSTIVVLLLALCFSTEPHQETEHAEPFRNHYRKRCSSHCLRHDTGGLACGSCTRLDVHASASKSSSSVLAS